MILPFLRNQRFPHAERQRHRSLLRFGGFMKSRLPQDRSQHDEVHRCAVCQKSCPPQVISMSQKKAVIDHGRCIRCYCHEMCPSGAIDLRMGLVARALDRFIDSLARK